MFSLRRALPLTALFAALLPFAVLGQAQWIPPQEPCNVRPGHHLVNGAQQHLKLAVEAKDEQRRLGRLGRAHEVLIRAITENNQGDNPGAWYYLGRYYVEQADPWGADSAFDKVVGIAPQCTDDVQGHLQRLYPEVRTGALRAWQEGAIDSALVLFALGQSLDPSDAELPLFMAMMFVSQQQLDSATRYLDRGIEIAGDNPAFAQRMQQAMLDVARGYEAVAFQDPSLSQVLQTRVQRDTLVAAIERDSARLAALVAEWSGRNLRPDVRAAVQRDSTALADQIGAARAQLPAIQAAHDRDSTAATNVLAGGLKAYEQYLERYSDDVETMLRLVRRYSIVGHRGRLATLIARIADIEDLDLGKLTQVGTNLFNDGMAHEAAEVLEIATGRNPYAHDALYVLSRVHYAAHDGEELRSVTDRLLALDPLNPQAVRMMAAAWDLAGNADSVRKYVARADSGMGWGVTVTQFVPTANAAILNGSVANLTARSLAATTLVFEFLDTAGTVLATSSAEIPPLEPRRRHALSVRAEIGGATGWRYRRQ